MKSDPGFVERFTHGLCIARRKCLSYELEASASMSPGGTHSLALGLLIFGAQLDGSVFPTSPSASE